MVGFVLKLVLFRCFTWLANKNSILETSIEIVCFAFATLKRCLDEFANHASSITIEPFVTRWTIGYILVAKFMKETNCRIRTWNNYDALWFCDECKTVCIDCFQTMRTLHFLRFKLDGMNRFKKISFE